MGATTAGVAFYSGNKYPPRYNNQLFALDYSNNWINVFYGTGDQYNSGEFFWDLAVQPGTHVTLESGQDGDICYIAMQAGEIHCLSYEVQNLPPAPEVQVTYVYGSNPNLPISVQFHSDNTWDREGDIVSFKWNFGDGQSSTLANPLHTYAKPGVYNVELKTSQPDGTFNSMNVTVYTAKKYPSVKITSPVPNLTNNEFVWQFGVPVFFNCEPTATGPVTIKWEYQFVHYYHYHVFIYVVFF